MTSKDTHAATFLPESPAGTWRCDSPGWPDDVPVWTGSCPCQPWSEAGKGLGAQEPARPLARLVSAHPPVPPSNGLWRTG